MSAGDLYVFLVAPNPTKVRLYLAEKAEAGTKIPVREVMVNLREGEQKTPEHLARNPLGKLPVLELEDGSFLTESLVIIQYLEELHPEPTLFGDTPLERAKVRELERLADTRVLMNVGRAVHASNSPLGLPPNPGVAQDARENLQGGLAVLDARMSDGRPFVAGERPSVADCTLAAALQFGRFGGVELPPGFDNIARWDRAYRERPPAKTVLSL